jgi:hypothetical protein
LRNIYLKVDEFGAGMKLVEVKGRVGRDRDGAQRSQWNLLNSPEKGLSALVVWAFIRRDLDASFNNREACVFQPVESSGD